MISTLVSLLLLCSTAEAAPRIKSTKEKRLFGPTVKTTTPEATVEGSVLPFIGSAGGFVESFKEIPFAQPPVGNNRLRPPVPLDPSRSLGHVDATTLLPKQCPQFLFGEDIDIANVPGVAADILETVVNSPLFKNNIIGGQEDCLTVNVQRPAGTKEGDNLPVMLWIFGGGFELGGTAMYDGSNVVARSVELGKPVVFAAVNYRVGGFGFLAGKEVLAEGSANLGLLDQRLGMQWVADNIAAFGGDPTKVTLWGESAGAISIFDQLIANNGDITYKGKPLFRGAIMNSGSAVPTDPVDCPKAQQVYDAVVQGVGCAGEADTLNCLRKAEYQKLLDSMNSVPGILSFNSLALSYLPRPDGKFLMASPETIATSRNLPQVPFILGDQKDEGTLFGIFTSNITTGDEFKDYLKTLYFTNTDPQIVDQFVDAYPDDPAQGSPFDTGDDNDIYPQFKRICALLGDAVFTMSRRAVLNVSTEIQPGVKRWSYLSQYDQGTPVLGTTHGSDLLQVFYGIKDNFAASAILNYFLNFAYNLDPNDASGGTRATEGEQLINWPDWASGNQLIQFDADKASLIPDNFRQPQFEFLLQNSANLHF
ncbi:hypothetical protein KVR01_001483 [Diaporthe batatas]|uniref:uncharacterized protein n=1 Tax=Diaporthe batatas TaxID=748121 RepID=UPI001D037809|nr:uncharacterized protein KVR01_001483 [Diaporthe batatas]KAG8168734.1 hypothetical protein KVR01_001483 [Diaporthe batatas]